MKHRARVITFVLATSSCHDERAAEPAPVDSVPAVTPAAGDRDHDRGGVSGPAEGREADDGGAGLFLRRRPEPTAPSHPGGIGGLAREVVEAARRTMDDPVRLVPDAAHYVARMRPAVLLGHPELAATWAKAEEKDPSIEIAMSVVRTCLGRLEAIDDVVIAFDDANHLVAVVHAKGLGTAATWTCLQSETIARGRPFELALTGTPRGEGTQLAATETVGWFPDDDTVVLASSAWDADVQARMRGEGTAAIEGRLAATMARIGPDDPLWLAGRITGIVEAGLGATPFAGIDDVALAVRIAHGDLSIASSFDAGEAADATHVRDELQRQLEPYRALLPMMGVPSTTVPKLAFVADGDLVKLDLVLTSNEVRDLREGIARTF